MKPDRIPWPDGKKFAFTVFDDTDRSTLDNVRPVYDFLSEQGFRTTKSVWPLLGDRTPKIGGETCENPEYLRWLRGLQRSGFEIGLHNARFHTSDRQTTRRGLDRFRALFGHDPRTLANHAGCDEAIYWGDARVSGINRTAYNLLTRFRRAGAFRGHVEGDPLFWGDMCRDRIVYLRNFVLGEINALKHSPKMPYHDPDRPFANFFFTSTEGPNVEAFTRSLVEREMERLEEEGGACIMYTHFAFGFWRDGSLDPRFRSVIERLRNRPGWFVPVSTLLDHIRKCRGDSALTITPRERAGLERKWLFHKAFTGTS